MSGDRESHRLCKKNRPSPCLHFDYRRLQEKGFAELEPGNVDLVMTFRGTGMIDVFNACNWRHVAFLDFDLQRKIHLDSAFGSPLIGLPFPSSLKHEKGVSLNRFNDLRCRHHYGFFVEEDFRNGGPGCLWNLDELILAIALGHAEDQAVPWFHIKPTGDTAPYYRRKYGALHLPTTGADRISSIPLGPTRKPLPHVHSVKIEGKTRYLEVENGPDPGWSSD